MTTAECICGGNMDVQEHEFLDGSMHYDVHCTACGRTTKVIVPQGTAGIHVKLEEQYRRVTDP